MALTYELIASATASGSSGTITFSSIPGTYTDLVLVTRHGYTSGTNYAIIRANGDGDNSNYGNTYIGGYGGAPSTGRNGGLSGLYTSYGLQGNTTLNFMSTTYIYNYSNSTTYKVAMTRNSLLSSGTELIVGCRRTNTNAITSLDIIGTSSSIFASGSTFKLYGIKAA